MILKELLTTEQQSIHLSFQALNALDKIKAHVPAFKITGGLSLIFHGLRDNLGSDIDITVPNFEALKKLTKDIYYCVDSAPLGMRKKEIVKTRALFTIEGQKIDAVLDNGFSYDWVSFLYGRAFRVVKPVHSIVAKVEFIQNIENYFTKYVPTVDQLNTYKKHLKDIHVYEYANRIREETRAKAR